MCEYCEKKKPILSKTINEATTCRGESVECETEYIVFIRGKILCIGDKDDCNCVEAVSYKEINFCPMCGEGIHG